MERSKLTDVALVLEPLTVLRANDDNALGFGHLDANLHPLLDPLSSAEWPHAHGHEEALRWRRQVRNHHTDNANGQDRQNRMQSAFKHG